MRMPIGFIGPLKKENEGLRKEIENLRLADEALRKQIRDLVVKLEAVEAARDLAVRFISGVEARSFRASGNSDAAMLSGR